MLFNTLLVIHEFVKHPVHGLHKQLSLLIAC